MKSELDSNALARLAPGDPVAQYGPFVGLTFVGRENGHVTLRDKHGNEKRVYEYLFLKHGFVGPNARFSHEEGETKL